MKELSSARTERRKDVLEIGGGARRSAERRWIEHASNPREQGKACNPARDLEATGADVLMRDAVSQEVEDRPDEDGEEPGPRGRAGRGAGRNVQRDDHARGSRGRARAGRIGL